MLTVLSQSKGKLDFGNFDNVMSRLFRLKKINFLPLKTIWQTSRAARWSLVWSLVILVLLIVIPFLRLRPVGNSQFIPLHYNIFFGVDKFGPWYWIFQLPVFGLLFLLLNGFFVEKFFSQDNFLIAFFSIITLILELILLVAMFFVVLLNL